MATAPEVTRPIENIELEERSAPQTPATETLTNTTTATEITSPETSEQVGDSAVALNSDADETRREGNIAEGSEATREAHLSSHQTPPAGQDGQPITQNGHPVAQGSQHAVSEGQTTTQDGQTTAHQVQLAAPRLDLEQGSIASHEIDRDPPPPYHPPPPPYSVAAIAQALNPARHMPKTKFVKFMSIACLVIAIMIGIVVGASQATRSSNKS